MNVEELKNTARDMLLLSNMATSNREEWEIEQRRLLRVGPGRSATCWPSSSSAGPRG